MQAAACAIKRPFLAAIGTLRRLAVQRDGNVFMLFGLVAIPIIIAAGIALDTARAYTVKIRLGAALDAAALSIGSQSNETASQLTTQLNNYFYNNYCKSVPTGTPVTQCATTIASETNISVQPVGDITAPTVTYTAQATVPTTFMRLVGVNNITVSVKAQTTKFPGMEIAVVLDNTGSMLCGANDGSPCATGVVASDTTCTNPSNTSRICTLRNAAKQFVATLQGAITAPQSIYMSIVPYVTTVNIGDSFCTGSTSCSNIAADATSGDFTDLRGNILPGIPITGTTSLSSTTVSSVAVARGTSYVSTTAGIETGMYVYGPGISSGTTVSSVSGSSISLSSTPTLAFTGNSLVIGPPSNTVTSSSVINAVAPFNVTGSWSNLSSTVTVSSTTGITPGMFLSSSSSGIPAGATVLAVGAGSITMSAVATASQTNKTLTISPIVATTVSGSASVTITGSNTSIGNLVVGMPVSDASSRIPANSYVKSITSTISPTTITISANATSSGTLDALTFRNQGGTTTTGSTTINNVALPSIPSAGSVIVGNGIPPNTTIVGAPSTAAQYAAGTGQLTVSASATRPGVFSSSIGACCNTALRIYTPVTYDSAYNTANPPGSSTTASWGGCVVEPTGSTENTGTSAVLNASASNPDTSEPAGGWPDRWYPFWWPKDTSNNWTPTNIQRQDTTTEVQGNELSDWLAQDGPNQGCPVSILPLTDLTTSSGQSAILNKIDSMWPRDAGGTQVHVGMIWGWRVLSPSGPFTPNNGHPLDYATASSTGWKKIVVLMTDGEEEWPATDNLTGLGQITDGKIGTTNTGTAVTNLGTRLGTVCSNMATEGFIIYTIGLGTGGANNPQLQSCPANGGFFEAATPTNLTQVFQNIANSIIHLRLTE